MLIFGTKRTPRGQRRKSPRHQQHMALEASRWQETARALDLCPQFTSLGSLEGLHVPCSVSLGEASPCCRHSIPQALSLHYYPPRERPATTSIICGWDHGRKQSTTTPVRLTCRLWAVGPDCHVRLVQRAPGPPLSSD